MYKIKKLTKNKPTDPFPNIKHGKTSLKQKNNPLNDINSLTPSETHIINLLKKGGQILLDIKARRVLIYDYSQGLRVIKEITIRMLSSLINHHLIQTVYKYKNLVQYALL